MPAHRYWRLLFTASTDSNGLVDIAEVVFKSGGVDVTVNGVASASSVYRWNGYSLTPDSAFDKNLTSYWVNASGAALPQWLAYDFGTAVNIDSFSINSGGFWVGGYPTAFTLQWSDDGVSWQTAQNYSTTWPAGQTTQSWTNLVPIIDTDTASPSSAPANTVRTITITAHDPNTPVEALASASLVRSDGGAVTPVGGQPAGTFKWNTTI